MKKRLVSFFMVLVMTMSLLPTAWAAELVRPVENITQEKQPFSAEDIQMPEEDTAQTDSAGQQLAAANAAGTSLLKELRLASGSNWENSPKQYLELDGTITPGKNYTASIDDHYSTIYAWVTAADGCTITVNGTEVTSGASKGTRISGSLAGPDSQTVTVVVTPASGESETYTVTLKKLLTLKKVSMTADGENVPIYLVEDGEITNVSQFYRTSYQYHATVSAAAEVQLTVTPTNADYTILLNDEIVTSPCSVKLDAETSQALTLKLKSDVAEAESRVYTITLEKKGVVPTRVSAVPGNATVAIYDVNNIRIWPDADGVFALMEGETYTYIATCAYYQGVKREFTAGAANAALSVSLEKAPGASHGQGVSSDWPAFRGGNDNNGVVSFKTPIQREKAVLSWAAKVGDGYDASAVSCPILIQQDGFDYLIVYSGTYIHKIDAITGDIVTTGTMQDASSYAINSPTYGDGMIFVGLSDGRVQAFDAGTLESLWVYQDTLGGQPNCPITYHNGYVYTGFWNGETKDANFVCLSAADEDPNDTDEEKLPTWTYTTTGGYYWAGAYVCDDYLLVGADDGNSGYSSQTGKLLCLNPTTGELLDKVENLYGDARSSISEEDGAFYFTSKGGYFYKATVTRSGEGYKLTCRGLKLENGVGGTPMSTSTPVVHNGRAYIGVSGQQQFTAYSGHNITVIDLNSWKIAYRVETMGYPQTSGLLTTAYEQEDGYTYVYFFDNYTPGILRVLKDKPGQTSALLTDTESYEQSGVTKTKTTAYALFTPRGDQMQYAICSPVADEYGTLYFKNDSGYLMALTSAVESVTVTKRPEVTDYAIGEHFDPTGMEVTVTYVNGKSRVMPACRTVGDVAVEYVSWSGSALTAEDAAFSIGYPCASYYYYVAKDEAEPEPVGSAALTLTVNKYRKGDVNGDGSVDVYDLQRLYEHCRGINRLTVAALADAGLGDDIREVQNLYARLTTGRWDSEKAG